MGCLAAHGMSVQAYPVAMSPGNIVRWCLFVRVCVCIDACGVECSDVEKCSFAHLILHGVSTCCRKFYQYLSHQLGTD